MTVRSLSTQTLGYVMAAVSDVPERPSDIHKRIAGLAIITVRHALRELVAAGHVEATGPDMNRRYRRKAAA